MVNKKVLGLLGLAARARQIAFGADSVEMEIKQKKVKVVILAQDASKRTKEKFEQLAKNYEIPIFISRNDRRNK